MTEDEEECSKQLVKIHELKVVIIGDPSTGKSSLLRRYCEGRFSTKYKCTIGVDFYTKISKFGSEIAKVLLWDTAGQERFRTMTKGYYQGASGCLIIYDITRYATFQGCSTWAEQYANNNSLSRSQIVALVGNKLDLDEEREVTRSQGEELAKALGCLFFEVSALQEDNNVSDALQNFTKQMLEKTILQASLKAEKEIKEKKSMPKLTQNEIRKPSTKLHIKKFERPKKSGSCC